MAALPVAKGLRTTWPRAFRSPAKGRTWQEPPGMAELPVGELRMAWQRALRSPAKGRTWQEPPGMAGLPVAALPVQMEARGGNPTRGRRRGAGGRERGLWGVKQRWG